MLSQQSRGIQSSVLAQLETYLIKSFEIKKEVCNIPLKSEHHLFRLYNKYSICA
jgi:hypothetical protein